MAQRQLLQTLLKEIVGPDNQVYFQPPAGVQMTYPCIVYERYAEDRKFAGNNPYLLTKRYQVTVIDRNPDSDIPDQVGSLPLCTFNRHFATEGLNHDVFYLYF